MADEAGAASTSAIELMLGYTISRYIHVFHGWVFGPIPRRMFLGSPESSRELSCIFETGEDAEYFLSTLKVEHTVEFVSQGTAGLHTFNVHRPYTYNEANELTTIRLKIHAMHSGLTRRKKLPRNIAEPCLDLDYFFWRKDGLREMFPPDCRRGEMGLDQPSWLAYAFERLQKRRFCVVNPLCNRSPRGMLQVLEICLRMVADEGFTQDNAFEPAIQTPIVFLNPPNACPKTFCAIKQDDLGDFEPAVRLPQCNHVFSFIGLRGWIYQKGMRQGAEADGTGDTALGRSVECPLCQQEFVSRISWNGPAGAAGLRTSSSPPPPAAGVLGP